MLTSSEVGPRDRKVNVTPGFLSGASRRMALPLDEVERTVVRVRTHWDLRFGELGFDACQTHHGDVL